MTQKNIASMVRLAVIAGATLAQTAFAATIADFPASTQTGVTYDKDIKPIFQASCFGCHGPTRQSGKLRLDSLDAVLKGGKDGTILNVGKSETSDIVLFTAQIGDTIMPPKPRAPRAGATNAVPPVPPPKPLTKDQVGLLRAWIDQGAK